MLNQFSCYWASTPRRAEATCSLIYCVVDCAPRWASIVLGTMPLAWICATKARHPAVENRERLVFAHQVIRLVIRVELANTDIGMTPKLVRHLNSRVSALPDKALIGVALLPEWFLYA